AVPSSAGGARGPASRPRKRWQRTARTSRNRTAWHPTTDGQPFGALATKEVSCFRGVGREMSCEVYREPRTDQPQQVPLDLRGGCLVELARAVAAPNTKGTRACRPQQTS